MKKFGWFKGPSKIPAVVYEADFMKMDKEYVQIWRFGSEEDSPGTNHLVAAIRLDKSQDVREL